MSDCSDGAMLGEDAARLGRDLIAQAITSDVDAVRERLSVLWTDPAIDIWLTSANAHLDGARPLTCWCSTGSRSSWKLSTLR